MHSRKFASILSRFARPGLLALALLGTARGDDGCLFQPMSGACFLHDSGMEYIPSRLLGVHDCAASPDRGDEPREAESWTCTDPIDDCVDQAEKFSRREALLQHLNEFRNTIQTTREWTMQSWIGVSSKAIKQWDTSAAMLGSAAVQWATIEQTDQEDCPWDRKSNEATVSAGQPNSIDGMPVFKNGNIFVFTFGAAAQVSPTWNDTKFVSDTDSMSLTQPGPRSGEWLEKTVFARDYCIFAPYPLADESDLTRQQATLRLKQSVSLVLARGMTWLGNRLLESGATLADSVRVASESDGSLSSEVK